MVVRVLPTRRLSIVAAGLAVPVALVVAAGVGPWVWVVAASAVLLALAALVDGWLAIAPDRVVVERRHPGAMTRGDTGAMVWELSNPARRAVRVAFADSLAPSLGVQRRAGARLAARGVVEIEHQLTPSRRGRFQLGPITLRTAGPLGLAARQAKIGVPGVLRVLPPFRSRRAAELQARTRRVSHGGLRSSRGRGTGTEFEQLREYVTGDDPRHIDWNATARSPRPIVRVFNVEQHQPVAVLLDTGRTMSATVEDAPRLEHAMDVVVAFAALVARTRDRVQLLAYDDALHAEVPPGSGARQVGRITEAVFGLEPSWRESDHAGALATLGRSRRRRLVVMATELHETVVAERLLPVIRSELVHHHVVVVAVRDPLLEHWATGPVEDHAQLHRAAAAVSELDRRADARRVLESAGATVIDDVPGRVAERLLQTYLDLKSLSR